MPLAPRRIRAPLLAVAGPISLDRIGEAPELRMGGAVYSAFAAVTAGQRARVIGPVGTDAAPRTREALAARGVETSGLIIGPWPTRRVRIEEPDEIVEQRTLVDCIGEPARYDLPTLRVALRDATTILAYGHAARLARAVFEAAPAGALLAIDLQDLASRRSVAALAARAHWSLVSWPSAAALTGAEDTHAAILGLRALGCTNVILKLGPGGAIVARQGVATLAVPALLGPFHGTVGAGDAFNGVFLSEIASGVSDALAATHATRAAAALIAHPDPWLATRRTLRAAWRKRVPAFSRPEDRFQIRVAILAPARTAAERLFAQRLSDVADTHGFSRRRVLVPRSDSARTGYRPPVDDDDVETALRAADVLIAVLDGQEREVAQWLKRAARWPRPVVGFWSTAGAAPPAARDATLVVRSEGQLLTALYAFAADGTAAWRRVEHLYQLER